MQKIYLLCIACIAILIYAPSIIADDKNELPVEGSLTDLTGDDPYYYTQDQIIEDDNAQKNVVGLGRVKTTHSKIPHLPVYSGYMNTNYTYRFVNIVEQTFTMVGEGKTWFMACTRQRYDTRISQKRYKRLTQKCGSFCRRKSCNDCKSI